MNPATNLPQAFGELERFVPYWALETNDARRVARSSASMEDIRAFYDAVVTRAEEAIAHCEQFELGQMPADSERLFKLLLAMNHAAIAVEMHGQPVAHESVWPSAVRITQGPWPHGGSFIGELT
jgi:hypothetical protein